MKKFHFVDFAAHFQKGFRNHVVSISEVPSLVKRYGHYGCYATYFFYADEILSYMATHGEERPSLAGYEGKVRAPYFLIDIDHKELEMSSQCARVLLNLFLEKWKVEPEALQIYFSGMKGFHVLLNTRVFGRVAPSKSLPHLFSAMRRHLIQGLPEKLRPTIDLGIKDRVRLIRLPNTIHEESGLYKIILSTEEVRALAAEDIRDLAKNPRGLSITDQTGFLSHFEVKPNRAAGDFFRRIRRQVRRLTHKPFVYHFHRPQDLSQIKFPCLGMQRIWDSHVEPGVRNNCAIRLASALRLLGITAEEAQDKLLEWNDKNQVHLPLRELSNVVHSAYQHPYPYHYSCHDEVLRHFCPLRTLEACQQQVISFYDHRFEGRAEQGGGVKR